MSIKGDFISFTYNGVHSTELGIVRTSSSNRYNDQLVPTSQDKTVPVPGGNGTYFFGSYYTQRAITLNIAYDEVTEATLRRMRKVFSADTIHPLIFDDTPYKVYYAKVSGQPQLNYIPFQNYDSDFLGGTPRIYKGEGTINFVCYDPFAHCPYDRKYLYVWNKSVVLTADDFEQGSFATATGEKTNHQSRVRTKKEIKVIGGLVIMVETNLLYYKCFQYDENYNYILSSTWKEASNPNDIVILNNNTKYVKLVLCNVTSTQSVIPITPEDIVGNVIFKNTQEINTYNYRYDNKDEWNLSANLLEQQGNYDIYNVSSGFKLYNPGDEETDFEFIIPVSAANSLTGIKIKDDNNDLENHTLMLKNVITPKTGDTHICFNSKMNLIQGYNNGARTGNTYNEFIGSGHWFKIPLNEENKNWYFVPIDYSDITAPTLKYDYLYY